MNLFTSKKYYSDNGVCSFHEFARELDEDYLRTQVNGGDCGGGAPSPSPSAQGGSGSPGGSGSGGGTGHGTGGTSSTGATTTPQASAVNPGAGETQNPGNQSNPGYTGGGGNYEPPKEVMSNPQAYAYWLSLQDKAMKEGDPGKYKDYNVVPDFKQNVVITDHYYSPFEKVIINENHQNKEERKVWFESNVVPTDDKSFIHTVNSSMGLLSVSAETDKETSNIYGKAQVDIASTSGVWSIKNGIDVGVQVNGLSASGAVGFQGQDWDCSVEGSVGWQFGFEIAFQKGHIVIDAACIFGGRIEINF